MSTLARVVDLGGATGHVLELRASDLRELQAGIKMVIWDECADLDKAREVHMYLVFNEDVYNSLTAPDAVKDLGALADTFAYTVHTSLPDIVAFRLRLGDKNCNIPRDPAITMARHREMYPGVAGRLLIDPAGPQKPDALESGRYLEFLVHLADAAELHLYDQLQEIDTPLCYYKFDGVFKTRSTTLKTIKVFPNGDLPGVDSEYGGGLSHVFAKLRWPNSIRSVHLIGPSKAHGFKARDVRAVAGYHCHTREDDGGLIEIVVSGHHDCTLRELSEALSGRHECDTIGLRKVTVPLPQYMFSTTRTAHREEEETMKITWKPATMFAAATILYAEHALYEDPYDEEYYVKTARRVKQSTLQSISFSNEDAEPTEIKITKDDQDFATFSIEAGEFHGMQETHGPLSEEYLGWMASAFAWENLEKQMLLG